MVTIKEIIKRESPKWRSEYILKENIKINKRLIPQLKNLLKRLETGEKPRMAMIGSTIHIQPTIEKIKKELKERKTKLPKLRKWLQNVRRRKRLKEVI